MLFVAIRCRNRLNPMRADGLNRSKIMTPLTRRFSVVEDAKGIEFVETMGAELYAETGGFYATKGRIGTNNAMFVHPGGPAFEPLRQLPGKVGIG